MARTIAGTLDYMSPEMKKLSENTGNIVIDEKTDVWLVKYIYNYI